MTTNKEIKVDKANNPKPKRASKSRRIHIRRMKQEARKTAGVTPART